MGKLTSDFSEVKDFKKRLLKLEKKLQKCKVTSCITGERTERRSVQLSQTEGVREVT